MKVSFGVQKSAAGESMRRTLAFLQIRMHFKAVGAALGQVSVSHDLPDRLDLQLEGVSVSLVVADDLSKFGGFVFVKTPFNPDQLLALLGMNPILLALHEACFSWCEQSSSIILSRCVPEPVVYDEDELFDFAVDSVRLLNRCEKMLTNTSLMSEQTSGTVPKCHPHSLGVGP